MSKDCQQKNRKNDYNLVLFILISGLFWLPGINKGITDYRAYRAPLKIVFLNVQLVVVNQSSLLTVYNLNHQVCLAFLNYLH